MLIAYCGSCAPHQRLSTGDPANQEKQFRGVGWYEAVRLRPNITRQCHERLGMTSLVEIRSWEIRYEKLRSHFAKCLADVSIARVQWEALDLRCAGNQRVLVHEGAKQVAEAILAVE
jgi:hypothetical protein